MSLIGPLGFTSGWLLLGLLALPLLWVLLRAQPPAPVRRRFPGVVLLLGLTDETSQSARTPWWLLLLRMAAMAALIIGFAGPVLNPPASDDTEGDLLIVMDASWAAAPDWQAQHRAAGALISEAARRGDKVALVLRADPEARAEFTDAAVQARGHAARAPFPWGPQPDSWADSLEGPLRIVWFSDGLARPWRGALLARLDQLGPVRVIEPAGPVLRLAPLRSDGPALIVAAEASARPATTQEVALIGRDPRGIERVLATEQLEFTGRTVEKRLILPPELRNRITRAELAGGQGAGLVALADDALRRPKIALISAEAAREGGALLSPLHYLRQALSPGADLAEGVLSDMLAAAPDMIVMADHGSITGPEEARLSEWIDAGGVLLRFAGPRLAAAANGDDAFLPVALRQGGRNLGGAMSWASPKALAPFGDTSPFFGLRLPDDVSVGAQVLAQPGPDLAARVIARLEDGTPLVTRQARGAGQVVLFHVTANADWSTLPLSGLFVQMLGRLAGSVRGGAGLGEGAGPDNAALASASWAPLVLLDGAGRLVPADAEAGGLTVAGAVAGADLAAALSGEQPPGPGLPPGLYESRGAGAGVDAPRRVALNLGASQDDLRPADWPASVTLVAPDARPSRSLAGPVLLAGLLLMLGDVLASLALTGRLFGQRAAALLGGLVLLASLPGMGAEAQSVAEDIAIADSRDVVLAHILTGDPALDDIAGAGLRGLSQALFRRSSVEPAAPRGLDLERDELAFYPLIYWPITADQVLPSPEAYGRLNRYLQGGGMIIFDTRDADLAGLSGTTPEARRLRELAAPLALPPLEPIPSDHVLTRTFYLLQEFPGRHAGPEIWVEAGSGAGPTGANDTRPFGAANDGVTPVVIGGNDWASAWAIDGSGNRLRPVGRGMAGERQREMAYRFGVNLVMHVLTGNYKSDQVHVPALLDRLGG